MTAPSRIEMLAIGDELLDGRVTDTNAVRFGRALATLGLRLSQLTTVTDDIEVIVREARAVMARGTGLCLVSGGLGPTSDDVTAEAFAELAGVDLVRDAEQVAVIEGLLAGRGRRITDNQRKQADRPRGATVLPNSRGTAPGFSLRVGDCTFVAAPGVPHELDAMVEAAVLRPLREEVPGRERRALYTFGLFEAEVDARLKDLGSRWPAVRVGYRAAFPEIHVSLSAAAADRAALEEAAAFADEALGRAVYSTLDASLAAALLELLRARGATLAVAESCTGGLVGDMLTDVAGASDVLLLGVVAYANQAKQEQLGVASATLAEHGAVSEQTALAMAHGARARAGATYGIAVTGIAGPGGGTPDKPVGTVWIAAAGPDGEKSRKLSLPFGRRRNKVVSAYSALDLLRRWLL